MSVVRDDERRCRSFEFSLGEPQLFSALRLCRRTDKRRSRVRGHVQLLLRDQQFPSEPRSDFVPRLCRNCATKPRLRLF